MIGVGAGYASGTQYRLSVDFPRPVPNGGIASITFFTSEVQIVADANGNLRFQVQEVYAAYLNQPGSYVIRLLVAAGLASTSAVATFGRT